MTRWEQLRDWVKEQRVGLVLIAVIVLAALAPVVYLTVDVPEPEQLDNKSCLIDTPPSSHEIVLIDATDTLDKNQVDVMLAVVSNEARTVHPHDKITIAAIDQDNPYTPRIVFSACAPKNRKDADWLSENPEIYGAFWQQQFDKPLMEAAQQGAMTVGQKSTPLVESIFGLTLLKDFGSDVRNRRLVIVSDMLQNTKLDTHYKGTPSFPAFLQQKDALLNVPDLKGVTVVARYLIRPQSMQYQTLAQRRFWEDYFRAAQTNVQIEGWPWPALKEWHAVAGSSDGQTLRLHRIRRHRDHIAASAPGNIGGN